MPRKIRKTEEAPPKILCLNCEYRGKRHRDRHDEYYCCNHMRYTKIDMVSYCEEWVVKKGD